ncbi:MAG: hypothetical protein WCD33_18450 [Mycobacterium sp.]|uniref:hypothetical protein n=1 Tax=Mycobacterium sp. TaxID=1785 RepID=UPI003C71584A
MHNLRDMLEEQTASRPRASTDKPPGRAQRNTRAVQGAPSPRSTAYEQTRSFMYVDDCIEGALRVTAGDSALPVNVGSSELVSINQMIDIIEKIAGITVKRNYNLDAPKGVRGRNSDNTLIKEIYGWEPSITLADGLERTYRWIFDQLSAAVPLAIAPHESTPQQKIAPSLSQGGDTDEG